MMNFKTCLLLLACLASGTAFAQKGGKGITIKGVLEPDAAGNPGDTMRLFKWDIALPVEIDKTLVLGQNGKYLFNFTLPANSKGYYFVGKDAMNVKLFVVENDKLIEFRGNAANAQMFTVANSPDNQLLETMNRRQQEIFGRFSTLIQQYRMYTDKPDSLKALDARMQLVDKEKKHLLDSIRKQSPILGKAAAWNTYYSYQHHKSKPDQPENEYFAANYLAQGDAQDEQNAHSPFFHEALKNYAYNLARVDLPLESQRKAMDQYLTKFKEGTPNHQAAIFAFVIGSMNVAESNFSHYGKRYLKLYEKRNAVISGFIKDRIAQLGIIIGDEAPEIREVSPEGDTVSLSAYRGKVLLVDFWASWCGPCRRVNPHVVELYNKYKDKGFDVLGVSLDRDKAAWVKAIEADGLKWRHVSDLNQWSSKWARLYGVSSIPHAVLLDREGRVLGRQLSPQDLDNQLKKIFGF